jgi:hypothetical protein
MGVFKRFTRPKANLSLNLDKTQLFLGDELRGIVTLKSQEPFELEKLIVSLCCEESVKKTRLEQETVRYKEDPFDLEYKTKEVWQEREYIDSSELYSDSVTPCKSMSIPAYFNENFSFTLPIPITGRETYHSVDRNVRWLVDAYVKIKGRKGIGAKGAGEIQVARSVVKPSPAKEVIREVVLIPCQYCGGLMPQTAIFCPNCGARRKA